MKNIVLNETPVRTSKNYGINNIEIKDFEEPVIKEFKKFAEKADVIIANRYEDQLFEVREKVYTRDLYSRD